MEPTVRPTTLSSCLGVLSITALCAIALGCSTPSTNPSGSPLISSRYSAPYDFGSTAAMGVYRYASEYVDLDAGAIDFRVNTASDLRSVLSGIDMTADHAMDGTGIGSEPSAYLYVRNGPGNIHQYRVVLDWTYLVDGKDWTKLYKIEPAAAAILRSHVKE